MRQVAVTEGDKVEAEMKFGFSVNTYGVGDLVKVIGEVGDRAIDSLVREYEEKYQVADALKKGNDRHASPARSGPDRARPLSIPRTGATLKDSRTPSRNDPACGMTRSCRALRHSASWQPVMGSRGEGDWKTAALVRAMKVMGSGLPGGNSFMEDYTYHFDPKNSLVLGAHMLEICESIADGRPSCEIHPLGIGGKADPVRLVCQAAAGPAINASIIDMGNRFRLLVNEVEAVKPQPLPRLPVARVLWKPMPDMKTGCTVAWILAGGAHHTCYSQNLGAEHLEDFADMAGIEFELIDRSTELHVDSAASSDGTRPITNSTTGEAIHLLITTNALFAYEQEPGYCGLHRIRHLFCHRGLLRILDLPPEEKKETNTRDFFLAEGSPDLVGHRRFADRLEYFCGTICGDERGRLLSQASPWPPTNGSPPWR